MATYTLNCKNSYDGRRLRLYCKGGYCDGRKCNQN